MHRLVRPTLVALLVGATSVIGCSHGYTKRDATAEEQRAVCALPSVDSAAWRRGVAVRFAPVTALLAPETRVVNDGFFHNYDLTWVGSENPTDTTSATVHASIDSHDDWLYVPDRPNDIPILTPGSQRTHFAECAVTIDGHPARVATYIENNGLMYGTYAAALRLSLTPGSWLRMTGTAPSAIARAHLLYEMRSLRFDAGATGGHPDPLAPACDPSTADTTDWTRVQSVSVSFLQPPNRPVVSDIFPSPGWNLRPDSVGPSFWCEGSNGDLVYGLLVHRNAGNRSTSQPSYLWSADGYVRLGSAEIWRAHMYLGIAHTESAAPAQDQRLHSEFVTMLRSAVKR